MRGRWRFEGYSLKEQRPAKPEVDLFIPAGLHRLPIDLGDQDTFGVEDDRITPMRRAGVPEPVEPRIRPWGNINGRSPYMASGSAIWDVDPKRAPTRNPHHGGSRPPAPETPASTPTLSRAEEDALDRAWSTVDALGGAYDTTDPEEVGFADALNAACKAIEKLGGMDPVARQAERRANPASVNPLPELVEAAGYVVDTAANHYGRNTVSVTGWCRLRDALLAYARWNNGRA